MSIAYGVRYTEVVTGDYIPIGAVIEFAPHGLAFTATMRGSRRGTRG
jgi:hypothetical protein